MTLDRADKKILSVLQSHGRISNHELAEHIGLSATPCARRVKRLEDEGYIQQYKAVINPEKLGLDLTAYLSISMDRHTPERFNTFESAIKGFPEVLECAIVTGQSADFMLKVIVKDMKHYEQFLLHHLTNIPGVTGVHSSFVLRNIVSGGGVDVNQ